MIRNWEYRSMAVKNMTDELNLERVRSIKNTKRQAYNCGGYALENFTWYCPYTAEQDENDETPFYTSRNSNELVDKCVDHMVEEYNGNLRVIKNVKELKPNEYAIAFRASLENDDFHFDLTESYFDYEEMGFGEKTNDENELIHLIKNSIYE